MITCFQAETPLRCDCFDLRVEMEARLSVKIHIPPIEALDPVKENIGRGTGMGTLIPTWPTSISCWNLRADDPEDVNIAQPLP